MQFTRQTSWVNEYLVLTNSLNVLGHRGQMNLRSDIKIGPGPCIPNAAVGIRYGSKFRKNPSSMALGPGQFRDMVV